MTELFVKRFNELTVYELHDILKLRSDVFVVEQECIYPDVDGLDLRAVHVFYREEDGSLAAYLRVLEKIDEPGVAIIGRVISAKRKAGMGRAIMTEGIRVAADAFNAKEIHLDAQLQAQGFYEKMGFTRCSEPFDDAGILHVVMRRKLAS